MATTKDKLQEAKQLIQQKKYDEARQLLRTVNHPTAQKWLAKLDELPKAGQAKQATSAKDNANGNTTLILGVAVGVLSILVVGLLAVLFLQNSFAAPQIAPTQIPATNTPEITSPLVADAIQWCIVVIADFEPDEFDVWDDQRCIDFVTSVWNEQPDVIEICHRIFADFIPPNEASFFRCVVDRWER